MKKITIVVLTMLALTIGVYAQSAPTSKKIATIYSQSPFSGNVAPGFLGHDARAMYRAIERAKPKEKGEFETTPQYEARLARADKSLYGALKLSSRLAFVVPTRETNEFVGSMYPLNLQTTYEADAETMNVKIGFDPFHNGNDKYAEEIRSIIWNEVSRTDGSYLGSNAFGAKVKVEITTETTTGLAFDIPSTLYHGKGLGDSIVPESRCASFHVSPQRAKQIKGNLRVLVITKLIDPYIVNTEEYEEPTIEYPYERSKYYHYLKVNIEDMWIFDLVSGEVFVKLSTYQETKVESEENPHGDD